MRNIMDTHSIETIHRYKSHAIFIIVLCAFFLIFKYILQVYPSVITHQLMNEFNLSGAGLGNLAATFYYVYMVAQLFAGIFMDKYSTRWLASFAILSSSIGLFIFSQTTQLYMAWLSRGLMGFGVAFATITYMKLAASWFPARWYAFIGGLLLSAAMVGAVFGEAPLAVMIEHIGWRPSLALVSLMGIMLSALFLIVVRDRPPIQIAQNATPKHITYANFIQVIKNKQNWLLALYAGLIFSPISVFGGLWGNPFLQEAYHVDRTLSATFISIFFIGAGVGSPIIGLLSGVLSSKRTIMFFTSLIALIVILLILFWVTMPLFLLMIFLFIFGFCLGNFMLSYAIGKELNPILLVGTVIALINVVEPFLDGITEPTIGLLLDLTWNGEILNGIRHFAVKDYQIALCILPLYIIIATILLFWIKEPTEANRSNN